MKTLLLSLLFLSSIPSLACFNKKHGLESVPSQQNFVHLFKLTNPKALLAIRCIQQKESINKIKNDLKKVAPVTKVDENTLYFDFTSSGVRTRTYLEMGAVRRQLSFVVNEQDFSDWSFGQKILKKL